MKEIDLITTEIHASIVVIKKRREEIGTGTMDQHTQSAWNLPNCMVYMNIMNDC